MGYDLMTPLAYSVENQCLFVNVLSIIDEMRLTTSCDVSYTYTKKNLQ